jgi:hypothetical protein
MSNDDATCLAEVYTDSDLIRLYRAGRLGITADGLLELLDDIYSSQAQYDWPTDRSLMRRCRQCRIRYRITEALPDPDKCPYCHTIQKKPLTTVKKRSII